MAVNGGARKERERWCKTEHPTGGALGRKTQADTHELQLPWGHRFPYFSHKYLLASHSVFEICFVPEFVLHVCSPTQQTHSSC